ncbi:hypothetical protein V7x_28820 [Crateriforma conspicua]|uniref:Uncharacterized protein n=1 Tax=Crateriforma conspicua TaxID=2527996 RepID=A0A5C6G101_9PLAN|nr:hypothetical protein [Crateriforma conspicua]TWU67308.1 hypothetical protein V7x_28820 [Crateriforma conspicua]
MTGTGNQSTIVFPVAQIVGKFTMIGGVDTEVGDEDVSNLATEDVQEKVLHDIGTMSDTEVEMLLNTADNLLTFASTPTAPYLKLKHKELITINWAARQGQSAGASLSAWGGIKKISLPEHVNNVTQRLKFTIAWLNRDNTGVQVKPAWTPATETP